jgi:hypothetical protein
MTYKQKFIDNLKKFITELDSKTKCNGTKKFLEYFDELDMDMVINRYYGKTKNIKTKIDNKDMSIFNEDFYIFPEINLSQIVKQVSEKRVDRFFTYMNLLTVLAEKTINEEFNPFVGVGSKNDFSVNNIKQSMDAELPDQKQKTAIPGIPDLGMLAQATGLTNMLNPEELSKQFAEITPDKIAEMKSNISGIMGTMSGDTGTNKSFSTMMDAIFDEIQNVNFKDSKNPFDQILNLAQKVSTKIEDKIDPNDFSKLVGSATKLASEVNNNENPLINSALNGTEPASFLNEMMKKLNK